MSTPDFGLYDVLNYRLDHQLTLAPVVLVMYHVSEPELALIPLTILLFPDGRLPSPRWRRVVGGYLVLALVDVIVQAQMSMYALTHHRTQVDTGGHATAGCQVGLGAAGATAVPALGSQA